MYFHDVLHPGLCVQSVDVLRNQAVQLTTCLPIGQNLVAAIGCGVGKFSERLGFLTPVFQTGRFAGQEIVVIDRLTRGPDSPWRTKIGYAAFGADSCAGKNNGTAGLGNPAGKLVNQAAGALPRRWL